MSVPDQATTAVIAAGIAACAALISLLTLLFNLRSAKRASVSSSNAAKAAERSNQIAMGQSESGLRTSITECRERYEDVCAQLEEFVDGRKFAELGEREQRKAKTMEARLRSSMENLANAYEIACSQYIDDKIDRIRFKRTYAVLDHVVYPVVS